MPDTICIKMLQFCRMRVAVLNPDGTPKEGAGNLYVTDQQISLGIGLNLEAGADMVQKTGCDEIAFSHKTRDKVKNLTLQLSLAIAEPQITQMLIGGTLLLDGSGNTRGYALPEVGEVGNEDGVSIEGWVKNIDGSTLNADWPYIRWVLGKTFWTPADRTLENNPIVNNFTGTGEENANWGDGPANDWDYASDRLYQYAGDTDLPEPQCIAQELIAS